jgi:ferric-dicitrate binding protein FerR (iron transport regulator)
MPRVPQSASVVSAQLRLRRWICAAVLLAAVVPSDSAAQDIGTAQKVVKDVWGGGLAWRVQPQRKVRFREQINVGGQSGVEFRLNDSTTLSIGENSEIWLDEFVHDPTRDVVEGTIKFAKGAMRFVGSAAKKNVTVEVPTGSIGIRGTAFNLRVDRAQFEIEVLSGTVEVSSGSSRRAVGAGEFVNVSGGTVSPAQPSAEFLAAMAQLARTLGPLPSPARQNTPPSFAPGSRR